jgi:hypothetical protein
MHSTDQGNGGSDSIVQLPFTSPELFADNALSVTVTESKPLSVQSKQNLVSILLRSKWIEASKSIFPIYLASHIVFGILTYLAALFKIGDFSPKTLPLSFFVKAWARWDSGQFEGIAKHGYTLAWQTAFFPLYPAMERVLAVVVRHPLVAGLLISNVATFGLFVILYILIKEDFNEDVALRTIVYVAVFPAAFFLVAAYNESIFLLFSLASFYCMRRSKWWYAGLLGFLAALTRSTGLLLFLPFCYEYARQHQFKARNVRFDVVSALLIPAGVAVFAIYCAYRFNDPLAFSHAQASWGRQFNSPIETFNYTFILLNKFALFSFDSIHLIIDLTSAILMLILLCLCWVGPWRFKREDWAYGLYTLAFYLFLMSFPNPKYPLQSITRQVIELFPAFLILAKLGKRPNFNLYYITIAGSILCFMLLQFLTGGWIV